MAFKIPEEERTVPILDRPPEGILTLITFGDTWHGFLWCRNPNPVYITGDRQAYNLIQWVPERVLGRALHQQERLSGNPIFDQTERTITYLYPEMMVVPGPITVGMRRMTILTSFDGKETALSSRDKVWVEKTNRLLEELARVRAELAWTRDKLYKASAKPEAYIRSSSEIVSTASQGRGGQGIPLPGGEESGEDRGGDYAP